jgi:hypothetical protein
MRYVRKPTVVEAFQFGVDEHPDWFTCHVYYIHAPEGLKLECSIPTLEGTMKAHKGDMIIKGIQGELYPCKKDIFEENYEECEDE